MSTNVFLSSPCLYVLLLLLSGMICVNIVLKLEFRNEFRKTHAEPPRIERHCGKGGQDPLRVWKQKILSIQKFHLEITAGLL